jgi:DNA invertase Pin-like site-specific DNA recombinase
MTIRENESKGNEFMAKQIIGYARVSTAAQCESGLGMEGQQAAIDAYAAQQGASVVRVYVEIESGRKSDRPELAKALAHAKRSKATLVVAKLDRLARNVAFVSAIMEAKADFVACDNPHANALTLHVLAAVAEAEAKAISERTRAALAAYKARGGKLGGELPQCRNLTQEARERGAKAAGKSLRAQAVEAYSDLAPTMRELRAAGNSPQAIADKLNEMGHTTRRGKPWNRTQVGRVIAQTI